MRIYSEATKEHLTQISYDCSQQLDSSENIYSEATKEHLTQISYDGSQQLDSS